MFPTIFNQPYSDEKYFFLHTNTSRTTESYENFVDELFGHMIHNTIPNRISNEKLIRPYHKCASYQFNGLFVTHHKNSEFNKFQNTTEFKQMLVEISVRLGLNGTLSASLGRSIWTACIIDLVTNDISPWCAVNCRIFFLIQTKTKNELLFLLAPAFIGTYRSALQNV